MNPEFVLFTHKLDLLRVEVTAELLEKLLPPFTQRTVHHLGISLKSHAPPKKREKDALTMVPCLRCPEGKVSARSSVELCTRCIVYFNLCRKIQAEKHPNDPPMSVKQYVELHPSRAARSSVVRMKSTKRKKTTGAHSVSPS